MKRKTSARLFGKLLVLGLVAAQGLGACPPDDEDAIPTDQFAFEIESASGAKGDVVGVTVFLRSTLVTDRIIGGEAVVCHDAAVAELVGEAAFSDELLEILGPTGAFVWTVDETTYPDRDRGFGFILNWDFSLASRDRFPSDLPLPLATIYYRLRGDPGATTELRFCDGALRRGPVCPWNRVLALDGLRYRRYLSTANVSGALTVVDGPATRPEPPPQPPKAKVYPELPPPEAVNFRVRITGAVAQPGARGVPVEVYVTADVEYSGIAVPIDFDERYLRLVRATDAFASGGVLVDNRDDTPGANPTEGHAVIYSGMGAGSRRLAAEGEEILAATLYFDVLEAAAEIEETELAITSVMDARGLIVFDPWIGVHYGSGTIATDPGVLRAEVSPIRLRQAMLKIQSRPTALGDVDLSYTLELTDAVAILSYLFVERPEIFCAEAADFNADGALDVSDPIALLCYLFLGGPSAAAREILCR